MHGHLRRKEHYIKGLEAEKPKASLGNGLGPGQWGSYLKRKWEVWLYPPVYTWLSELAGRFLSQSH